MTQLVERRTRTTDRRPPQLQILQRDAVVPVAVDQAFAFFADASNLERLTPPWLNFTIRTAMPIVMRQGTDIDYSIRLYGFPMQWRSRIDIWEPHVRFVDRQIIGPYRWWWHEHRFEAVTHGTRVIDNVEYLPKVAWLSSWKVRHDLERVFDYRQLALREVLTTHAHR